MRKRFIHHTISSRNMPGLQVAGRILEHLPFGDMDVAFDAEVDLNKKMIVMMINSEQSKDLIFAKNN